MVGGDRSFKLALTEKDEEFSDELRDDCEVRGDGEKGKEMGWRGGNETGEGEGGRREIPVSEISEVVSAPYTNSVCVGMEVSCSRAKGVFLLPPCVCPPLTTTGDPPSCPLHAGPS